MRISVLGCGWLGFPLAQHLLREGYAVRGSTTSREKCTLLKQAGIEPILIQAPDSLGPEDDDFWKADILFLNIPPGRGDQDIERTYPKLIRTVLDRAEKCGISWVIFASSTSVYSSAGGLTHEDEAIPGSASRPSGEAVLKAEAVIKEAAPDYTILRFGGLYGYDRHPVKYLAGKKELSDPMKPVNLIHQVDCIRAVDEVIRQKKRNEVYNVVSDGHPPRKAFYQSAARHFELPLPEFCGCNNEKDYRIVSNEKLKNDLKFEFSYPNPMDHTP